MSGEVFEKILVIVFTTFMFVLIATPFVKKIALHIGAVDMPNERKIHKKPMPRLGGIAIFLGFLLGYMLFGQPSSIMNSILIGSFIIVLTGVVDDIKPLKAIMKLAGQIISALVVVFYGEILLKDLSAFGLYIDFGIFAYPITIFFIVGCINCINLIDGLDGLSSGISAIYFLTIGIIATMQGKTGLDFVLAFVMFGSTLGFLIHNFYPARIFAGDSGSMFMGFIISIIALLGFKNVTMTSLLIPIFVLAIPILDTIFAIIRRFLKGERIFKPDRFHIHHQLLNLTFNQRTTVIIIYAIDLLFACASIVYVLKDKTLGYIVYGLLLAIVILFVTKTNVIMDHDLFMKKLRHSAKKED